MASAAEQLAANLNFGTFAKATELKKRIWFTLGALIVFRLGTYIPVPGVDPAVMSQLMTRTGGGILGMFDMFSGGALGRMTVFALNIMPYISASIIIQLMASAIPSLEAMKKEGETGRRRLNQYTRYLTAIIAIFQSYGIAVGLESMRGSLGPAVIDPGMFFRFTCVVSLVGGTMFLMWLGEQITARGVGNGSSLIIFAGIVANLPSALVHLLELGKTGALSPIFVIAFIIGAIVIIGFVVFMERAQRRIIIQYPKRQVGQRVYGGESQPHAAEDQYLGRDSADLRELHPAYPGDRHRLLPCRRHRPGLDAMACRLARPWPAGLHAALCRDDHLLLLFLYGGGV